LVQARRLGVNSFAFQSTNELLKIKKCNGQGAKVYLRLMVPDSEGAISFSSKFGANYVDAVELIEYAKTIGLNPIGLTFHVGSQAVEVGAWDRALELCKGVIGDLKKVGIIIKMVNLGGGYPVQYNDTDPGLTEIRGIISSAVEKHIPNVDEVITEPGRYLVADSSCIVSTIIGVEERGEKTWLFLDVGTFQAFIEIFEFHDFPYPVYSLDHISGKAKSHSLKEYVLSGPSCDSYDTMTHSIKLPSDLAVGNKLLIDMTGAYTVVYGSNFNGFKVPQRKFIK